VNDTQVTEGKCALDGKEISASGFSPFSLMTYSPSTPYAACQPPSVLVAREG